MLPSNTYKFEKLGRVFRADGQRSWMTSHSACPQALHIGDNRYRVYFGTRDRYNHASIGFFELSAFDPATVLAVSNEPALEPGGLGCFDENGVYPGTIMWKDGRLFMFYMGRINFEHRRYGMAIGLAESNDGGITFKRLSEAPVLDRHEGSPWMVSMPCVVRVGQQYRMWYVGGTRWPTPEKSSYRIREARSRDLRAWRHFDGDTIPLEGNESNHASPTILFSTRCWHMWFSSHVNGGYRLCYARSKDGKRWTRDDLKSGLSSSKDGFDREIAYPHVVRGNGKLLLFYSGNEFGREGIGLAVAEDRLQ